MYIFMKKFQDKSIVMIFIFPNSTTYELFKIYNPNVSPNSFPKRLLIAIRRGI
jgi:hypothetical protein